MAFSYIEKLEKSINRSKLNTSYQLQNDSSTLTKLGKLIKKIKKIYTSYNIMTGLFYWKRYKMISTKITGFTSSER